MAFCLQNTTKLLDRSIKVRPHGSNNTNKVANAHLNHTQSFTTFLLATRPFFLFNCSYQIALDSDTIKGVGIISQRFDFHTMAAWPQKTASTKKSSIRYWTLCLIRK